MSQKETVTRYSLIIKKLRKSPSTFEEIYEYLAKESDWQEYNFRISKRTFQRDVQDIRAIYQIDIQYDLSRKVYFIDFDEYEDLSIRILEAFDTFNALNLFDRVSHRIHFEKRRPQGTDNLYGLLHAIKNQLQLGFMYHKFWEDTPSHRIVEPYALKEFKNRWYLLANDLKDNNIKTFGLDRLSKIELTDNHFRLPENFNLNQHFKHCFGIISPNGEKPEKIILSFEPIQGKYIKTLPLHESQKILIDNEIELQIQLTLIPTFDFIMELLSFGSRMKVIQPQHLAKEIKQHLEDALKHYTHL